MQKKTVKSAVFTGILAMSFVFAAHTEDVGQSKFYDVFTDDEQLAGWIKRIELSSQWETDQQPRFYFQTVQPLYQDTDEVNTFFVQPRASMQAREMTYNLGLGYRHLATEDWLLGVNVFGDYEDEHEHGRVGVGVEAIGQIFELRSNGYFGITEKRIVENSPATTTFEEVADGFDVELGTPVPYLPWLRVYGSGFWYDFKQFEDKYGWRARSEAKINEMITLEAFTWDDNKGDVEFGGRVRFYFAFDAWSDFKEVLNVADDPYPKRELREETLAPVERDFNIVVERYIESGTLTIEIGRGT